MTVMQVGVVRMLVGHRLMPMAVRMGLAGGIRGIVLVLMVRIVRVPMLVLHRRVLVRVAVAFAQVKVEPEPHQQAGAYQAH